MPPGVGQPVEYLPEVLLRAREPVHQQKGTPTGARFADGDGKTAGIDRALLHQRPPVKALRSTTWSAGGTTACTGTPKSNSSSVNVTEPGTPGVDAATFDLLRSTVYFRRRARPWASTQTSTGCVEDPSNLIVDLMASRAVGERSAALLRSTTAR